MAKKVAKRATKKRVKKHVERGQAHIQSSFNNTNKFRIVYLAQCCLHCRKYHAVHPLANHVN